MKRMIVVLVFLLLSSKSASTETHKKMIITLPLKAHSVKCDWSKEFPIDMVCEVEVPTSATRIESLMALRPTVWTEEEWNGQKVIAK